MLKDIDMPTMFVRDESTHLVTPKLAPGCEWAKEDTSTLLTIKLDGELVKVYLDTHTMTKIVARRIGGYWFRVSEDHPADRYIWEAYQNTQAASTLPEGFYVAFGPNINGNAQGVDSLQMIRIAPVDAQVIVGWGAVSIHRGAQYSDTEFYEDIKRELEESTVEGFVFQLEKPSLQPHKFAKVTRKDMGFPWPIPGVASSLTPSELAIINDPFAYVGD